MVDARAMGEAVRLGAALDALAALAAYARVVTEDVPVEPAARRLLADVAGELLGEDAEALTPEAAVRVVGLARTFLRQAADLVDNPGRAGGWDQVDVPLLQSIGRMSMGIVDAVRAAAVAHPGLGERVAAPGARVLDVGTGTGWLAVALARVWPQASVVGIDLFAPALDLARANVAEAGLEGRVELRLQDAADLDEPQAYDAVWLPMPFLPRDAVPAVVAAAVRALRPGGWLLPGTFTGPEGRLPQLLTDLRTVRSGGHPWTSAELVGLLAAAGLEEAGEIHRTWTAPVRLYAARRP